MAFWEELSIGFLRWAGAYKTSTVTTLAVNGNGNVTLCSGSSAPSGTAGYAIGCLFVNTSTGAVSANTGTASSCTFTALIANAAGSVALTNLASGIAPSHIVKYAGTVTWSGGGTSKALTVTGVVASDIVMATIKVAPTQAAYLVSVAPTTDTITFTLSAANTSNDAQISYTVFRAAS